MKLKLTDDELRELLPKKVLKAYEEKHFISATQDWDSHTEGLKIQLEGIDTGIDLCFEALKGRVPREQDTEKLQHRIEELERALKGKEININKLSDIEDSYRG